MLKLAGIRPIFAHPERIRFFEDDIRRYESVIRLGAYGQLTTGSLLGVFGRDTLEFSRQLVRKGLVHVVASDAHNIRGRPPILSEAVRELSSLVGEDLAAKMVDEFPGALLRGEHVELPEIASEPRGTPFLSRWFGRR